MTTLYTYSLYLSTFDLSSLIIPTNLNFPVYGNGLIVLDNDVMNHVDCVMKRDVYPQRMHSCSKNIRDISVFCSKDIRGISKIIYHG